MAKSQHLLRREDDEPPFNGQIQAHEYTTNLDPTMYVKGPSRLF